MKSKKDQKIRQQKVSREEIMKSMIASFKIEGIHIYDKALDMLKQIEQRLKK